MRTLARVDLPDPFGPMMAWISPGRTLRLTPRRISLPSTVAWRSSTSRIGSAISHHSFGTENMSGNRYRPSHVDVVALDLHLVGGHGLGGRQTAHGTGAHRELRPVLGAFHLVALEPALVQLDVLVAADVVDCQEFALDVPEAHGLLADHHPRDLA